MSSTHFGKHSKAGEYSKDLVLLLAVLGAACTADQRTVLGPEDPLFSLNVTAPQTIKCDLAVRVGPKQYRTKQAVINNVPKAAPTVGGDTIRLVLLSWETEQSDPSRVASCLIADTPEAIGTFETLITKDHSNEQLKAENGKTLHSRVRGTTSKAVVVDIEGATCESYGPLAFGCSCSELCEGWAVVPVTNFKTSFEFAVAAPPTSGSEMIRLPGTIANVGDTMGIAYEVGLDPEYIQDPEAPRPVITCYYITDDIHISTTPGFFGRISVHGWAGKCTPISTIAKSVRVELQKEYCISFYCWWHTTEDEPVGYNYGTQYKTDAHQADNCSEGFWRGHTKHKFFFPPGYTPIYFEDDTYSYSREIYDYMCGPT